MDSLLQAGFEFINKMGGYYIDSSLLESLKSNPRTKHYCQIFLSHEGITLMNTYINVDGLRSLHEVIQEMKNQYQRNWNIPADKVEIWKRKEKKRVLPSVKEIQAKIKEEATPFISAFINTYWGRQSASWSHVILPIRIMTFFEKSPQLSFQTEEWTNQLVDLPIYGEDIEEVVLGNWVYIKQYLKGICL